MISHNTEMLRQFCDSGLVIEAGQLTYFDTVAAAIDAHDANLMLALAPEGATYA
jgi:capsular polysaccharide transport system ATP-binding protein